MRSVGEAERKHLPRRHGGTEERGFAADQRRKTQIQELWAAVISDLRSSAFLSGYSSLRASVSPWWVSLSPVVFPGISPLGLARSLVSFTRRSCYGLHFAAVFCAEYELHVTAELFGMPDDAFRCPPNPRLSGDYVTELFVFVT